MKIDKLPMKIKRSASRTVVILLCFFTLACSDVQQQSQSTESEPSKKQCNNAWFEKVEQQVITGDGQGHGPDLGSIEWRSVVEFKLGVRGDESLPAVDSDPWCAYIDQHFIR
ncbi:hypothetical protein L2755_02945 [Shewanella abyssi]|uniref:hypothetical protein n=1 Tax=Shewanella abyssi TaxID=311789 RepID=UPI00200C7542|nr:hypothetical protein [Shewanella abyssi]MCL1048593.1 hypothetical protein [Shewanella abyssi]